MNPYFNKMQKMYRLLHVSLISVLSVILLSSCGRHGLKNTENGSPDNISSCMEFTGPEIMGPVESDLIIEASGLASSRKNSGVLWTHNDSGGLPRIFAMNLSGNHLGIFNLLNAENYDWEDIAAGPGPVEGQQYLYIGDIGDNDKVRSSISVYRMLEPVVDRHQTAVTMNVSDVDKLQMQYPGNQAYDAETLLVDPVSGDLFIVTKNTSGSSKVFRNPSPHTSHTAVTLEEVATIGLGTSMFDAITGGDISADGGMIIIRSYSKAFILDRVVGSDLGIAFSGVKCFVPVNESLVQQGEAIAFDPDGRGYTTVIEGLHPSLKHYSATN